MASALTMSMLGLSKPTTTDLNSVVKINPYHDMASGKGIDTCVKLAMDPENAISTLPEVGGITDDEMRLQYLVGLPSLVSVVSFLPGSTPFELSGLGPYGQLANANVDYMMLTFAFWSGSMKFKFYITASLYHTVRGVFWLGETSPVNSNWENAYHKVVDIQGDTEVEFSVPYCDKYFATLGTTGSKFSVWFKILSWSQPDLAISAPIHINVYKAGDSDMRFGGLKEVQFVPQSNPRMEFNKSFDPLHESMTGYEQKGYLFGEEYTSMREIVHKYHACTLVGTGSNVLPVYDQTTSSGAWLQCEKFGLFYRFRRGSKRWRFFFTDAQPATKAAHLLCNNQVLQGFTMSSVNNKMIEVEAPWYKGTLYDSTTTTEVPYQLVKSTTGTGQTYFAGAMGDDFSFHFARTPQMQVQPVSATRGQVGLLAFYNTA